MKNREKVEAKVRALGDFEVQDGNGNLQAVSVVDVLPAGVGNFNPVSEDLEYVVYKDDSGNGLLEFNVFVDVVGR